MWDSVLVGIMQGQAAEADKKFLASLTPEKLEVELRLREIKATNNHAEALRNQHITGSIDHRHWGL